MTASLRFPSLLALVVGGVLLSACTTGALSIDTRLTLQEGEYWKASIEIVYAREQMEFMGGEIERGLEMSVSQWKARGISASYSRRELSSGDAQFRLSASGKGFAQLNAALFDNTALIQYDAATEPPQITFQYAPIGSFFSLALSRSFTLTGGQILSSNGAASGDTVTWVNPVDVMQATLTPAPRFNALPILLGGGVLLAAAGGVAIARGAGKARCPLCGAKIPRRADYCPMCGGVR
ncbi:MAG: zinc ribbon domain-containing protein [Chloroflexi bacterium]|nr:zinc ribbon domain-containing protein [Chloroflexota bacterium]